MISSILQPFNGTFRDSFEALAVKATGGTCRIVSAWATPDGIGLANDLLYRNQVSLAELVLGINRSGTSARALRVASAVVAQSHGALRYYLDGKLGGPLFHAKLYYLQSKRFRGAIVGSANLTREGLLNNVEAGVILTEEAGSQQGPESAALDQVAELLDGLGRSEYSVPIIDGVIERLVEIGAIPETGQNSQREDADRGDAGNSADDLLNIAPRARSAFRALTALPGLEPSLPADRAGLSTGISLELPAGSRLRYVRYYGLSEANRVKKFFRGEGATGTFEPNITMTTTAEKQFWGYPDRFVYNLEGTAREWSPRVRLITVRDGQTRITPIPSARLWTRIRDDRESEVRFRFANTSAVRSAFPTDIEELTIMVVDRVEEPDADYEVRLVGKADPGYSALRPVGDGNYEYRVV